MAIPENELTRRQYEELLEEEKKKRNLSMYNMLLTAVYQARIAQETQRIRELFEPKPDLKKAKTEPRTRTRVETIFETKQKSEKQLNMILSAAEDDVSEPDESLLSARDLKLGTVELVDEEGVPLRQTAQARIEPRKIPAEEKRREENAPEVKPDEALPEEEYGPGEELRTAPRRRNAISIKKTLRECVRRFAEAKTAAEAGIQAMHARTILNKLKESPDFPANCPYTPNQLSIAEQVITMGTIINRGLEAINLMATAALDPNIKMSQRDQEDDLRAITTMSVINGMRADMFKDFDGPEPENVKIPVFRAKSL